MFIGYKLDVNLSLWQNPKDTYVPYLPTYYETRPNVYGCKR